MLTFPPFDPDGTRVLTFDCSPDLDPNEVLSGGPVLKNLICTAGIDVNPLAMILGPLAYDATGRMVLVPVGNLSAMTGNDYEFEVASFTTEPNKYIVVRALLQVRVE